MAVIENLDIVLGARTEKLDNGLDRSAGRVRKFESDIGKIATRPLQNVLGAIPGGSLGTEVAGSLAKLGPAGAAAGAAVAAAFVAAGVAAAATAITIAGVRDQMGQIDATADAAKRLGFEFNELVTLRLSLGRSTGMGDDQIDAALSKMQLNLAEARSGSGALADQLKSLGLDAGQLLKAGPVEAMKQISSAAQQMKSPIDQNKLAFDLAGKAGVAMAQALRDGPDAIDEAATKAKQLGLTLSQVQTEQVGAANDAWEDMQLVATGVFRQIAAEVSPVITAIATSVTDVAEGFGGWEAALPAVVDNAVLFSGVLYDTYEMIELMRTGLYKIATLDFSGLGESISAALDVSTGQKWVDQVNQARQAAKDAAATAKPPAGDGEALQAEADAVKQASEAAKKAADERDREAARNKEAVADRLGGLRDEVSVLGQAASAADRLKLARQGATAAQLAEFDFLVGEKEKQATKDRGKALMEQYRTPMQEFNAQLQDLNKLLNVGAIDFNTYAKATRDAAKKAGGESAAAKQLKDTPLIGALQRGSVEAYSQANKNDKAATAAKLQEQANILLQQVNVHLEAIARQRQLQLGKV